jgi:peptide/nickel transport system permease protein
VLVGQSMPTFWSGILLIMLFGVGLGWLPTSGADDWRSVIMPAVALGGLSMATFARITRTAVMEELGKDYVRAIRAKGVAQPVVVIRHVLRNGAVPIVTIAALEIANLLAGAVIVETVFAWPGMGQLAVQSIQARDFLVVQAIVLLVSVTYVLLNFAADMLYGVIDPRIRLRGGAR